MSTSMINKTAESIKKKLSLKDYKEISKSSNSENIESKNVINTEKHKNISDEKREKFCFYISKSVVKKFLLCHSELSTKAILENKKISKSALLEEAIIDLINKKGFTTDG